MWWILAWIFAGGLLGAAVGVLFCDLAYDDEFVVLAFCGALFGVIGMALGFTIGAIAWFVRPGLERRRH